MFNNQPTLFLFLMVVLISWVSGITYLLLKTLSNYNRLSKGVSNKTLSDLLNDLIKQNQLTESELKKTRQEIRTLGKDTDHCISKVGLVRFNPFADTGGDQSFTLALLNSEDTGIVVTSLYARTGVRWYIKNIRKGKGVEHELSKEEGEAVNKAK